MLPLHGIVFRGMLSGIERTALQDWRDTTVAVTSGEWSDGRPAGSLGSPKKEL